jgi:mono/diheme cytochrome c family protein
MTPARRRILLGVGAIIVIAAAAGIWMVRGPGPMAFAEGQKVALADYKAGDPTGVPTSHAGASLVERGEYLTKAADCAACHTSRGGKEFAGGLAIRLPFGALYSTNITPDRETGIGNYSDQDFLNALQHGTRRDGARLYPAMPFTSYSYMTDADALAIKAYLFSLPPVRAVIPANTLTFPFNQRWAMTFWSLLFNSDTRFAPDASKSLEWNRGAYLTEAFAHCGECHTPRSVALALDNRKKFAGAVTAGWRAFNITSDKATGIGDWRDEDIIAYLSVGHATGHGTASGPMGEPSTTASAKWPLKTSVPWWSICVQCPQSPLVTCRGHCGQQHPRPTSKAARRTHVARSCSRVPASVAMAGPVRARFHPLPRSPAP